MGRELDKEAVQAPDSEASSAAPAVNSFCVAPFLEANIMPTGAVRACCAFYPSVSQDGRPMSVYEHSVEEIWNSDTMRDVRRRMIEGKAVDQCSYCYLQERTTPPSLRNELNPGWEKSGYGNPRGETIADLKSKAIANDFRVPAGPSWIDLELGNLCNLKCRMCSSTWSSSIAADPVHSRWSSYDIEGPARWQGRAMVIAPRRALGITYEGLSGLDQSGDKPLAWFSGAATIRVKKMKVPVASIQVRIAGGAASPSPIEIFANDASVFRGELSEAALETTFDLPKRSVEAEELVVRLECPVRAGIEEIKLLRAETGRSNVGVSRFSSGKQWFQDEDFIFNDLLYKVDNLTKLHMVGGETLLIKQALATMRYLIAKGAAKNIMLSLVTNGTIANDEVCDLAAQFKSVLIGISLDGFGDVNDYIRHPSCWAEIEPNIRRLKAIPNASLYVNATVQAYNMLHMPALARYIEDMGLGFRYHFLIGPAHLSCLVMPVAARKEAARRIRAVAMRNTPDGTGDSRPTSPIGETLLALANVLETNTEPPDPKLLDEFMLFTNDLDASRGQDFASVNSELLGFIEASGACWSGKTKFAPAKSAEAAAKPSWTARLRARMSRLMPGNPNGAVPQQ